MTFQNKSYLPSGVPLPFFMTHPEGVSVLREVPYGYYPGCIWTGAEKRQDQEQMIRDFEYLRQTYPAKLRKLQRRVEEILETVDYEGSMIYDEYPDQVGLQSLGKAVTGSLMNMEEMKDMDEEMVSSLAQVLVCNEIYRRRQKKGF